MKIYVLLVVAATMALAVYWCGCVTTAKSSKRALQKSHEKPIELKRAEKILDVPLRNYSSIYALNKLLLSIDTNHLSYCSSTIFYQAPFAYLMNNLLRNYAQSFSHGSIDSSYELTNRNLYASMIDNKCQNFYFLLDDVMETSKLLWPTDVFNTIVIVTQSSQWKIFEFLGGKVARQFLRLLIVSIATNGHFYDERQNYPFILYTHKLYTDGTGSSKPTVLTSWYNDKFLYKTKNLFPSKIQHGFAKHRFILSLTHNPPFTLKKTDVFTDKITWDGIEIRLLNILSSLYNFSIEYLDAKLPSQDLDSKNTILATVKNSKAYIGASGLYVMGEVVDDIDFSPHYIHDCASFISLKSLSLSKYRAIFGPFQWTVWLSISLIYLLAVFLISFADKHNFNYLVRNPQEIEHLFWNLFGTLSNCFRTSSELSWTESKKLSPKLLITSYAIFSIIISSCYTGSIIAFITIPVSPTSINTIDQLLDGNFRIGTLSHDGWQYWFENIIDRKATRLLRKLEYVDYPEQGIKNITSSFFSDYAFLGSREYFSFVIKQNFTQKKTRKTLHVSSQCLVPFHVSFVYPKYSIYSEILNNGILKLIENGFVAKIQNDFNWSFLKSPLGTRTEIIATGVRKLKPRDRIITIEDSHGIFLLLALGVLTAGAVLLVEIFGGFFKFFKKRKLSFFRDSCSSSRSGSGTGTGSERTFDTSCSGLRLRNSSADTIRTNEEP